MLALSAVATLVARVSSGRGEAGELAKVLQTEKKTTTTTAHGERANGARYSPSTGSAPTYHSLEHSTGLGVDLDTVITGGNGGDLRDILVTTFTFLLLELNGDTADGTTLWV